MRPSRLALWFALTSAFLAFLFLTLGNVSIEPLDHPQWLMAGYWPVRLCYAILIGYCMPGLYLSVFLLRAFQLWDLIASPDLHNSFGQWCFVVYPLMQGIIYGGAAWILASFMRCLAQNNSSNDSVGDRSSGNDSAGKTSSSVKTQSKAIACAKTYWRWLAILAFIMVVCIASRFICFPTLPSTWYVDFDRDRYIEIHDAIKADKNHLLGKSFDEISKQFRLENVPWDDVAFQRGPNDSFRIYHFRGFAFYMTLEWARPKDGLKRSYTMKEVRQYGVLRLAYFFPFVRADGINDPKEWMKRHWDKIEEECHR
jgi:hypothetical protein